MTANLNPNLFRLSLPEWLKEQVESGKHKGVFWINEEEKIFHVPWKHASRNGWEDGDVSLFKAWAIYTNRYREGIDKPKPALWKTNFRCAINSHNYITFMKDQGQRKGDKAHRIMKLIEQPKDKSKSIDNCTSNSNNVEPHRKRVRITYPSSGEQSRKRVRSTYSNTMVKGTGKADLCEYCKSESLGDSDCCGDCSTIDQFKVAANATNVGNSDHEYLTSPNDQFFFEKYSPHSNNSDTFKSKYEIKTKKPNLEDLYFVGKALQSIDDSSIGLDISIKTKMQHLGSDILQKYVDKVKDEGSNIIIKSSFSSYNDQDGLHVLGTNINSPNGTDDDDDDDDDDLITPRDAEGCR